MHLSIAPKMHSIVCHRHTVNPKTQNTITHVTNSHSHNIQPTTPHSSWKTCRYNIFRSIKTHSGSVGASNKFKFVLLPFFRATRSGTYLLSYGVTEKGFPRFRAPHLVDINGMCRYVIYNLISHLQECYTIRAYSYDNIWKRKYLPSSKNNHPLNCHTRSHPFSALFLLSPIWRSHSVLYKSLYSKPVRYEFIMIPQNRRVVTFFCCSYNAHIWGSPSTHN